jgi:group II intron reverse transcriptase/maturase
MLKAFKNVKRNRGRSGIDKISIQLFEENLEFNLNKLMKELKTRDLFQPKPARRVWIPKGKNELRPLGIPAVRDRIAQEVLRLILEPIFEPLFHQQSYGFRPKRNCHQAVEQVLNLRKAGYKHVLDADIQGFFDNIPHSVIMASVANEVADGNILGLIQRFLQAGVMDNGVFKPTTVGTPQGSILSPLLANITLNSLDWTLDNHGIRFVRYADDFVVLCQSKTQAEEARIIVESHLKEINLTLNPEKTHITTFHKGFEFLGFKINSRFVTMRPKSVVKFKDKIREITRRCHNLDKQLIEKVNAIVRGTANYYATAFSHVSTMFNKLDMWLRVRLRAMKFKRKWRTDNRRLRVKHLQRKGIIYLNHLRENILNPLLRNSRRGRPMQEKCTSVNGGK